MIPNYRWRLGLAAGKSQYDDLEWRLAALPVIAVPAITLEGDANGAPHLDAIAYVCKFPGKYEHRVIKGRHRAQSASGSPAGLRPGGHRRGRFLTVRKGMLMAIHWRTPARLHTASAQLPVEGRLASFDAATGWLNSRPADAGRAARKGGGGRLLDLHLRQLAAPAPLCSRLGRELPGHGLVVIGVHAPEFGFERNPDNVRRAVKDMGIEYPVAIDSDYAVWRALDNYYWPALSFADAERNIRHHHFGEGEYQRSEMVIRGCWPRRGPTAPAGTWCRRTFALSKCLRTGTA